MGPGRASASGAPSTGWFLWISTCLILVLAQMSTSLMFAAAEFIRGPDVHISPFRTCRPCGAGGPCCVPASAAGIRVLLVLGLYVPVALVSFALLATLFSAYAKDGGLQCLSAICQAASSLLLLTGIVVFSVVNRANLAWGSLTPWFYACVGVQAELVLTSVLTYLSWRRMTPDLKWNHAWIGV